jgi:amino acid transporter
LNVGYTDPELPIIYDGTGNNTVASTDSPGTSRAIIIIAALKGGYKQFPGLLNGCMMFSVLSAANTALYISSRAMYGMTRTIHPWKGFRWLRMLGTVWHRNGVPMWALFISAIAFFWLPFLQLKANYTITNLLEIMNVSASVACLFVWGTQCLAFIRYYAALSKHRKALAETYPEFNRWASTSQSSTFLAGLQPFPAWGGLIGCFLIVFIFTSATWWDTPRTFSKVAVAYGAVCHPASTYLPQLLR